jgi:hypothetical protein
MAGKGQTPWQKDPRILTRMGHVEDLHLMGWTNVAIAAALTKAGTPTIESTVRDDLKRLKVVWHERLGDDMQQHRDRAVMQHRRIQRAAWQEFQAVKDTSLNKSAYLNTVKSAEDSISKVLGIEAASKVDVAASVRVTGTVAHEHHVAFDFDAYRALFAEADDGGATAPDDGPSEPLASA